MRGMGEGVGWRGVGLCYCSSQPATATVRAQSAENASASAIKIRRELLIHRRRLSSSSLGVKVGYVG